MHRLAIYDMDKTITRGATWTPFLTTWATQRRWGLLRLLATSWPAALYLAKRIDRARLKEMSQRLVMGDRARMSSVEEVAARFAERIVAQEVGVDARTRIAADKDEGYRIVIATASYDFYVRPIAQGLAIGDVIATPSTVEGDLLVPKIAGENCYKDAKLRMILDWMAAQGIDRGEAHVRFYSDHISDAPTLGWANEAFAVNPDKHLAVLARKKGWPILRWR